MKLTELEAIIEAILFVAGEAVSLSKISHAIEQDPKTTKAIIYRLMDYYRESKRGIQVIEINGSYQMCTHPQFFEYIQAMGKMPQKQVLTQSLLETLAIVAYKQPVTKAKIEEIRGVNSDHTVNKLVERKLICEVGRLEAPGKPLLFGTTNDFLRYFGFRSIHDLPQMHTEMMEQFHREAEWEVDQNKKED